MTRGDDAYSGTDRSGATASALSAAGASSAFAVGIEAFFSFLGTALAALVAGFLALSAWRRNLGLLRPRLTLSKSPRIARLVDSCPALHRPLRPPLLLQTSLAQLIAYLLKRNLVPEARWTRETLTTEDGGEIALEWYECCDEDDVWNGLEGDGSVTASLPSDAPVMCVLHTLTGTAADFVVLAREATRRGFRPVVCLRRGHLDAPLRTPKFNLLGNCDDLDVHLEAIRMKFPAAKLFGYGESAGTGLAVRYSGEKGTRNPFAAVSCVCPGYDTTEGGAFSRFEPLLDRHLLASVKEMFLSANEELIRGFECAYVAPGYDELIAAPDMAELQRRLYGVEGYSSLAEYHERTNPMGTVRDIAVPMLVINSDDDPICAPSNVDDNLWAFEGDVDRALVRTPIGTHCCFYEGRTLRPRSSWAHEASLEFFESVLNEKG